jgi:hypothetical protein
MNLTELLAGTVPVTIGGVTYQRRQLTARDWQAIEQRILSKRADPVTVALRLAKGAPLEAAREIISRAYDDARRAAIVTVNEIEDWRQSLEGMAFQFYLQLNPWEAIHGANTGSQGQGKPPLVADENRAFQLLEQFSQEYVSRYVALLQEKYPEATEEQIIAAMQRVERGAASAMIDAAAGMPEKNSSTPATAGETERAIETSPSPGSNGVGACETDTIGPTKSLGD